jgi:DNA-binding transcriptional ArsR family regulator
MKNQVSREFIKERYDLQEERIAKMASIASLLSTPARLKILNLLTQSPHSVELLAEKIQQNLANTSMHLNKMLREGMLTVTTQKQKRIYSLASEDFKVFWEHVQDYFFLSIPAPANDLNWSGDLFQLKSLLTKGKAVLIDLRPEDEFQECQKDENYKKYVLPLSFEQLHKQGKSLSKGKTYLLLCRGRLCATAEIGAEQVRKMGFTAYNLGMSWFQLSLLLEDQK